MLSRRNLRIKVMQTLYLHQMDSALPEKTLEKQLLDSLTVPGRLYNYLLLLLTELAAAAAAEAERVKQKHLPTDEEKSWRPHLAANRLLLALGADAACQKKLTDSKLPPLLNRDVIAHLYKQMKADSVYRQYATGGAPGLQADKDILAHLLQYLLTADDEQLDSHLEELFPHWQDDCDIVVGALLNNMEQAREEKLSLFVNEGKLTEEKEFARLLLQHALAEDTALTEMIKNNVPNWDVERIAVLDMILLKMALCELIHFPHIPVKVTINEYIDISRAYSTPRSHEFVNGVLDKLMKQLKKEGRIAKTGRGLAE